MRRPRTILIGIGVLLLVCVVLGIIGAMASGGKSKATATTIAAAKTPTLIPTTRATTAPTAKPTNAPTAIPTPKTSPAPTVATAGVAAYRAAVQAETGKLANALNTISQKSSNPQAILNDPDTRTAFFAALGTIRGAYSAAQARTVPAGYEAFNAQYLAALHQYDTAASLLSDALNGGTADEITQANAAMTTGSQLIKDALAILPKG